MWHIITKAASAHECAYRARLLVEVGADKLYNEREERIVNPI